MAVFLSPSLIYSLAYKKNKSLVLLVIGLLSMCIYDIVVTRGCGLSGDIFFVFR